MKNQGFQLVFFKLVFECFLNDIKMSVMFYSFKEYRKQGIATDG